MVDLLQDFPSTEEGWADAVGTKEAKSSDRLIKASKRKRDKLEDDENGGKKPNNGAGDRSPRSQIRLNFGTKGGKIVGSNENGSLQKHRKGQARG